jgi:hypothetical protein
VTSTDALIDHAASLQRDVYALQREIMILAASVMILSVVIIIIDRRGVS